MNTSAPSKQQALIPLLAVNFIGTLGYSLVIPFLVFIVTRFGGNEVIYGLMGATYSFFQLFGAPLLGRYSDQFGRRKILFVSQLGTLLSWIIFLITLSIPVTELGMVESEWVGTFTLTIPLIFLFAARALDGLTGGNISVATAYVVDISPEEDQTRNLGRMALSTNLGFILGPTVAGILGATALGEKLPVMGAIGISVLGLMAILFFLPESKPHKPEGPPCPNPTRRVLGAEPRDCHDKTITQSPLKEILAVDKVPLMLLLYFLVFLAFNTFYATFPIHAIQGLKWDTSQLGVFFSVLSGTMIFVQGPVLSRLSAKFSNIALFAAGSLLMFASFYAFTEVTLEAAFTGAVLFATGNGIMWPSYMAMLAKLGPQDKKGYIQGVATGIGSFAGIIGLLLGGLIYARLGSVVFFAGGAVFILCFIVSFFMADKPPVQETTV